MYKKLQFQYRCTSSVGFSCALFPAALDCISNLEQILSVETITVELILYSKNSVEQNIVDVDIVDSNIELILDLIL